MRLKLPAIALSVAVLLLFAGSGSVGPRSLAIDGPQSSHRAASRAGSALADSSAIGMNTHLALRYDDEGDAPDTRAEALELLSQANVAWAREEFAWEEIELWPNHGDSKLRWSGETFDYPDAIRLLSGQGIEIVGLLTYGPRTDPTRAQDYVYDKSRCNLDESASPIDEWLPAWQAYVREVVDEYKAYIHTWEIGNEPNVPCMWRKVDPSAQSPNAADYVKLLKAAQEEIRAVDPDARIVLAGLSPGLESGEVDYFDYLAQVHAAGGWPYFDIVAIHPYRAPYAPEEPLPRSRYNIETLTYQDAPNTYTLADEIAALQRLISHWGTKPVWFTELGWATEALGPRAEERQTEAEVVQADYLVRSYIQAIGAGVENVMWYDWRDDPADVGPTESSFGALWRDLTPKPGYYALQAMAGLLDGATFAQQVRGQEDRWRPGDDDVHEYRFVDGSRTVIVLWKTRGGDEPRDVVVEDVAAASAEVVGPTFGPEPLAGGRSVPVTDCALTIGLTERPVFIVTDTPAGQQCYDAQLVRQPGFVVLQAGLASSVTFEVQNTGLASWRPEAGLVLERLEGEDLGAPAAYALGAEVAPGQVARWEIPVTTPVKPGVYPTAWQMARSGTTVGPSMTTAVIVVPGEAREGLGLGKLIGEWANDLRQQSGQWVERLVRSLVDRTLDRLEEERDEAAETLREELERLWAEAREALLRRCCGAAFVPPAAVLGAAWGAARGRRKGRA